MAVPSAPTGVSVVHLLKEINKHRIAWTANSASESVTSYSVYRCQHRYGTFASVGSTASTSYDDLPPACLVKDWYYKVSATNSSGESALSDIYSIEDFSPFSRSFTYTSDTDYDYYSDEDTEYELGSIRKQILSFLEMGGENCYLRKRKYSEAEDTGESSGTGESYGRKGEYHDGYSVKVKFVSDPEEKIVRYTSGMRTEIPNRPWIAYLPHKIKIADNDVIIDMQNNRFEVTNVIHHRFRKWLIRSEFDLTLIQAFENKTALDGAASLDGS